MAPSDSRTVLLGEWLAAQFDDTSFVLEPASADASFRRYFRVTLGGRTWIAMDAPPPQENCGPFVSIARLLRSAKVNAPEVFAEDLERGFLLLSDLGSTTYLTALDAASAPRLYRDAIAALIRMQLSAPAQSLPLYDRALLQREMDLYPDWYIARHKGMSWTPDMRAQWERGCAALIANNLAQPAVFVHRDYHSRNLMVCEGVHEGLHESRDESERTSARPAGAQAAQPLEAQPNPGILDFQDAVCGPITYDLVSLLKDAYIRWDEEFVLDQVARYWGEAKRARLPVASDFALFYRDFEWMGVQRQLKVLGIFARLYYRDGKAAYLDDMPRVLAGLTAACARYRELEPLQRLIDGAEENAARSGLTF